MTICFFYKKAEITFFSDLESLREYQEADLTIFSLNKKVSLNINLGRPIRFIIKC